MEKNQSICALVEAIGSAGEGIIRHEGVTFFVPACLPNEKVRFKVLKIKDKIGYGKLEEVLTPAEERVREKCPVFSRCGGCALQHLDYTYQLAHKSTVVKDALRKIGGIQTEVPTAIKSDVPYGYRNKLQMPVGVDKDGNTVQGSKRAKVVKAIVAMDLSREEKLLLIASSGYALQDGDIRGISAVNARRILLKYILSMKGTQDEKAALAEACGFEVKNGKILRNSL